MSNNCTLKCRHWIPSYLQTDLECQTILPCIHSRKAGIVGPYGPYESLYLLLSHFSVKSKYLRCKSLCDKTDHWAVNKLMYIHTYTSVLVFLIFFRIWATLVHIVVKRSYTQTSWWRHKDYISFIYSSEVGIIVYSGNNSDLRPQTSDLRPQF